MDSKSGKDIAVFTFASGTQYNESVIKSESYLFVERIIDSMMKRSGVNTPKVGIGGTKEDVCCFIAGLIEYQLLYNINIVYDESDSSEFDPDSNPEIYDDELG